MADEEKEKYPAYLYLDQVSAKHLHDFKSLLSREGEFIISRLLKKAWKDCIKDLSIKVDDDAYDIKEKQEEQDEALRAYGLEGYESR